MNESAAKHRVQEAVSFISAVLPRLIHKIVKVNEQYPICMVKADIKDSFSVFLLKKMLELSAYSTTMVEYKDISINIPNNK